MLDWGICYLCLQAKSEPQAGNAYYSLNDLTDIRILGRPIPKAYKYCTGLKMDIDNDKLPTEICDMCFKKLTISCNFKKQCIKANKVLRNHLASFACVPNEADNLRVNYNIDFSGDCRDDEQPVEESQESAEIKDEPFSTIIEIIDVEMEEESVGTENERVMTDNEDAESINKSESRIEDSDDDVYEIPNNLNVDCIYEVVEVLESSNDGFDEVQQINDQIEECPKDRVQINLSDNSELSSEEGSIQSSNSQEVVHLPKTEGQENQKLKHVQGIRKRKKKKQCTLCGKLVYDLKLHLFAHKHFAASITK